MYESVALLFVLVGALVVIRVGALALERTGLPRDIAHFQAQSAFMGVGFTTSEAETVVRHPVRRQVVVGLMWAGFASSTAAVGTIVATLLNADDASTLTGRLVLVLVGAVLILLAWRARALERLVDWSIKRALRGVRWLEPTQIVEMLELGDHVIAQVNVRADAWMAHRPLGEMRLTDEGVLVLSITRSGGTILQSPGPRTPLLPGDVLVCYGPESTLEELPTRTTGPEGAARRHAAEELHRAAEAHEAALDAVTKSKDDAPQANDPG